MDRLFAEAGQPNGLVLKMKQMTILGNKLFGPSTRAPRLSYLILPPERGHSCPQQLWNIQRQVVPPGRFAF